uniref:SFRICE_004005 n=1 Tax=Spodoptera frugiperda TaxID=7108 RepID=A0A2H1V625_SPOFR
MVANLANLDQLTTLEITTHKCAQTQVHSWNPMGRQTYTTEESSGARPTSFLAFRGPRVETAPNFLIPG